MTIRLVSGKNTCKENIVVEDANNKVLSLHYNKEKETCSNPKSNKIGFEYIPEKATIDSKEKTFAIALFDMANKANEKKATEIIERDNIVDEISNLLKEVAMRGEYSLVINISKYTDNEIIQGFICNKIAELFEEMGLLVKIEHNLLELSFLLNL